MSDKPGFRIDAVDYPLVTLDEWRNSDFVLARTLTKQPIEQLVGPDGDRVLFQQALVAVAINHGRPTWGHPGIVEYVGNLKPGDVEETGFEAADDASSPNDPGEDEAQPNSSSPTSDKPTAVPQAT